MAKIGVGGAGGNHQIVVGDVLFPSVDEAVIQIEPLDLLKQGNYIAVGAED